MGSSSPAKTSGCSLNLGTTRTLRLCCQPILPPGKRLSTCSTKLWTSFIISMVSSLISGITSSPIQQLVASLNNWLFLQKVEGQSLSRMYQLFSHSYNDFSSFRRRLSTIPFHSRNQLRLLASTVTSRKFLNYLKMCKGLKSRVSWDLSNFDFTRILDPLRSYFLRADIVLFVMLKPAFEHGCTGVIRVIQDQPCRCSYTCKSQSRTGSSFHSQREQMKKKRSRSLFGGQLGYSCRILPTRIVVAIPPKQPICCEQICLFLAQSLMHMRVVLKASMFLLNSRRTYSETSSPLRLLIDFSSRRAVYLCSLSRLGFFRIQLGTLAMRMSNSTPSILTFIRGTKVSLINCRSETSLKPLSFRARSPKKWSSLVTYMGTRQTTSISPSALLTPILQEPNTWTPAPGQ